LTANLLVATAYAQAPETVPVTHPSSTDATDTDYETESDLNSGRTRVDSAVLFYQEAHGRVQAIEPVVSATLNGSDGEILNVKITSDTLTGATPNGAAPWRQSQTFSTPTTIQTAGTTATRTSASGRSTIVTIPGTATAVRQYTADPSTLPLDYGFQDQRYALDAGYSRPFGDVTRGSIGGGYSHERDFQSFTGNVGFSRDFNQHNTTINAGLSYEYDQVRPAYGAPTPFTVMSGSLKGGDKTKSVVGLVAGFTQVINRSWLTQFNYSVGQTSGYQNDPYRIISVVSPTTGAPQQYLYEGRPDSRLRQSIYWGNKIALGPTYADISARAYHDSWGIDSITVEASDRVQLGARFFLEPGVRYYSQGAADFFHDYLLAGQPTPSFASSDSRLGKFDAVTASLKVGFKLSPTTELYAQLQDYRQSGTSHPSGVPGQLASENLFSGVNATSMLLGVSFAFW
jgi:hypothetical protein